MDPGNFSWSLHRTNRPFSTQQIEFVIDSLSARRMRVRNGQMDIASQTTFDYSHHIRFEHISQIQCVLERKWKTLHSFRSRHTLLWLNVHNNNKEQFKHKGKYRIESFLENHLLVGSIEFWILKRSSSAYDFPFYVKLKMLFDWICFTFRNQNSSQALITHLNFSLLTASTDDTTPFWTFASFRCNTICWGFCHYQSIRRSSG